MENIKNINEFFDGSGAFGDTQGYGGGNGIFKITYRPFKDLGLEVGQDPNLITKVKGAEFQIGDVVVGIPVDSKKNKVVGMIVKLLRTSDNKGYRYFIQATSKKLKDGEKIIELKPYSLSYAEMGNKGNAEPIKGIKGTGNSDTVYTASDLGIETVGG